MRYVTVRTTFIATCAWHMPHGYRAGSPVHAIVDAVQSVSRAHGETYEVLLKLLHDLNHPRIKVRDLVDVRDLLVGAMRRDGACRGGVHAGELAVGLHVGIVDVHLVAATEVLDAIVVHHGGCSHGSESHQRRRSPCCHRAASQPSTAPTPRLAAAMPRLPAA